MAAHPQAGSIALLITSDEEGPSIDGTAIVCDALKARGWTAMAWNTSWTGNWAASLPDPARFASALSSAILAETGVTTELSTTGGTSDGRFIAKICPQVIEFGPCNATIHKVNERIEIASLDPLKNIYRRTLENLLPVQP